MSRLPVMIPKDAIRVLEKAGFLFLRQRGSHRMYTKGNILLIVPFHSHDMRPGTLRHIIKQSGMSVQEFCDLI